MSPSPCVELCRAYILKNGSKLGFFQHQNRQKTFFNTFFLTQSLASLLDVRLNYHRVWAYYTNASSHDRTHKVQIWRQHSWISVKLGFFHHCPSSSWLAFWILPAFHRQARLVEHLQGQQTHSHLPLSWGRNSERIFRKCVKEKEYLMEDCSSSLLGCCRSRTPSWDLSKDVVPHV